LWRYIFFINIPIGLASIIILWLKVKESRDEATNHSLDYPGGVTIILGLAMLTFGFLRIPDTGFQNWQVGVALIGGLSMLIFFIFIEKNSSYPMMPLSLFTNRMFSGVNLLTFFLYAGLSGGMLFLTLNLVQAQGYSQLQAGLTLLPFTILMVIIARLSGSLVDRYGPRWLLILGPSAAGLGLLFLSFVKRTAGPQEYWETFFPGICCFGLGMSFTVAPLTTTVMSSLEDKYAGTASGINNAMTRIASVFANAIFGAIAILFFTFSLRKEITSLPLDDASKKTVLLQASNLGNAAVPVNIEVDKKAIVIKAYKNGFIAAYSAVMKLCSALAFIGALMSFLFVENIKAETKKTAKFRLSGL
ncbi:MAG: MFS transporter, partial [Bacteroidota bacterium]|nr:MFS transporter [Bacteroidota bacterium]